MSSSEFDYAEQFDDAAALVMLHVTCSCECVIMPLLCRTYNLHNRKNVGEAVHTATDTLAAEAKTGTHPSSISGAM